MKLSLLVVVLVACGDNLEPAPALPYVEVAAFPVTVNRAVDVLFVLDDSVSGLERQGALKRAFPRFLAELDALEAGRPSLHIGVVSTDLGTSSTLDAQPGPNVGNGPGSCAGYGKNAELQTNGTSLLADGDRFLRDVATTDGTRTVNYTGDLAAAFSAIASLGGGGCGFEQPIEAMRRALIATNVGFLRADANLAIVMVSDEDDCSLASTALLGPESATLGPLQSFRCTRFGVTCREGGATPDEMNNVGPKFGCHSNEASEYLAAVRPYADIVRGLKANPRQVYLATFAAAPEVRVELRTPPGGGVGIPALAHSCVSNGANGVEASDPGVRVAELTQMFERHAYFSNVCSEDYTEEMVTVAREIRSMTGDACIGQAIPAGATCAAYDLVGSATTELPICDEGHVTDCYRLVEAAQCTAGDGLRLEVERSTPAAAETIVSLRCRM